MSSPSLKSLRSRSLKAFWSQYFSSCSITLTHSERNSLVAFVLRKYNIPML